MTGSSMKSITLIGSSSGRNAGDAALMSSIMDAVNDACGTDLLYEIPTIKPGFVRDNYRQRVRPIGTLPWNLSVKMLGLPLYRSIMRTDLTLVFDAILFDRALYNPLFNFLSTLQLLLPLARRRGKRLACYNVGAGPVTRPAGRAMLRRVADMMDFVTVRDRASYDILMDIGVTNPRVGVAADAALNTKPSPPPDVDRIYREIELDPNEEILALNVNAYLGTWSGTDAASMKKEEFLATYCAAINRVIEELQTPVLLVATQHLDVPLTREVLARLRSTGPIRMVSNKEHSHYDVKGVLSRVSLLFAMRLHSMILASSGITPVAGLAYQPKVHHYFELLGMPEHSLGFEAFSEEAIVNHVLTAWKARHAIRETLEKRIPELQALSNHSAELVACLRNNGDMDAEFKRLFGN